MIGLSLGLIDDLAGLKIYGYLVARLDAFCSLGALHNGQTDVDAVAVEDPCEAGGDHHGNAAGLDGNGRMLPGGAAAKVPVRHHNVSGLNSSGKLRIDVLHAVGRQRLMVRLIEVTGRDNHIRIHVGAILMYITSNFHRESLLSQMSSGVQMVPFTAEAAATAGEARTTSLFTWPMRPTKFRLVVEIARSPA